MNTAKNAEKQLFPNLKEFISASAFFLFFILIIILPCFIGLPGTQDEQGRAASSFSSYFLGHSQSDLWKHVWDAWWIGWEAEHGRIPLKSLLQNYPEGGKLYAIDPFNASVSAFMSKFLGLTAAYNFTHILQLYLSCMGAWILCSFVIKDKISSLAAGVIYGLSPFVLTSGICSGICETANIEWLPLSLCGLIACFKTEHPKTAVCGTALLLALGAFGCWYYSMTCIVCAAVLFIWTAVFKERPVVRKSEKGALSWFNPLAACLLSLALASPSALMFADSLKGEGSLLAQIEVTGRQHASNMVFFHKEGNFKNNASLLGYFLPGKSSLSSADDVDLRMKTVYLGIIAFCLACIGFCCGGRSVKFWGILGFICLILSAGPYLNYWGEKSFSLPVNPLYWIAYNFVPGFKMAVITDRLSIAVQMCCAVCAGFGIHCLTQKFKKRTQAALMVLLGLCICAEIINVSPVPFPLCTAEAAYPPQALALAEKDGDFGVIELPLNRVGGQLQPGEYYYWQTVHHKPMPISLTTRFPKKMFSNILIGTLYMCEDPDYGQAPAAEHILSESAAQLSSAGFRWICVNKELMDRETFDKVKSVLDCAVGEPERCSSGSLIYTLKNSRK